MAWQPTRLVRLLLLLGIVVVAVCVRLHPLDHLLQPQGLLIHDLDTLRRLARLTALDHASQYPLVEVLDGYPIGSTLHWTLPMDWVIRGLDPLVSWLLPTERGYEAGAVIAGPLLAAAAICVLVLLSARLVGHAAALVAGALYGLAYSCVNTTLLGNGDHQALQQVAVAVSVPSLWLALRAATTPANLPAGRVGRSAWRWALLSGMALGFAVWVSTELMLLFYVLAVSLAAAALWPWRNGEDRQVIRSVALPWGLGVATLLVIGSLVEQRGDVLAMHWDAVSSFQTWQVAVFVMFALGLRRLRGKWAAVGAGGLALALGLLPLVVPAVRAAFRAQLHAAAAVNVWLQNDVAEFRSLLRTGWSTPLERDSLLLLALPFVLRIANPALLVPSLTVLGTFALYVWEVKLGHLFAAVFPLALVMAWSGLARRVALAGQPRVGWLAAGAAIVLVFLQLPAPRQPLLRNNDRLVREICSKIAAEQARADTGVLAPWDMGAPLMYHARVGAVATGYHRNLAGIHDAYRFFLTDIDAKDTAMEILRRRRVRWVVAWYSVMFFESGPLTLGMPPLLTGQGLQEAAARTMFWKLRYETPPGFRLVAEGPQIQRNPAGPAEPIYRLWEVVR